jgi:hypothetical protein
LDKFDAKYKTYSRFGVEFMIEAQLLKRNKLEGDEGMGHNRKS